VTLAQGYQPYGKEMGSIGSGLSSYGFTGEMTDPTGLIYLRARYYVPYLNQFIQPDTIVPDPYIPADWHKYAYVRVNPINSIDPSGQSGIKPWCKDNFSSHADAAERYVDHNPYGDYLHTYTAAGIGVQCRGTNWNWSSIYSGEGIAQITDMQTLTEWGKPIYEYNIFGEQLYEREGLLNWQTKINPRTGEPIPIIRGYGIRWRCQSMGELEEARDQNDKKNAVILMRRQLQLVIDECIGCTPTDLYIAAALAQNGPGFSLQSMRELARPGTRINDRTLWGGQDQPGEREPIWVTQNDVKINWDRYFRRTGNADDTQRHLMLFDGVARELQNRRWYVPPDLKWQIVDYLKTIGD
jgi:RHS repeat-associated protein